MSETVQHFEDLGFISGQLAQLTHAVKQRPERKQLHILSVDDQRFTRVLLYQFLSRYGGCVVDTTPDAREALSLYCQNAYDIAFLDIEIAHDNGHTLARIIKEIDPDSYIVMVTANSLAKDIKRAQENGVDGFIAKPFNKEKIIKSIESYLARKAPEEMHERICEPC